MSNNKKKTFDVVIIGGLGHVGLPLGIVFSQAGLKVILYDIDQKKAQKVKKGKMPFLEHDAERILKRVIKNKKLHLSTDKKSIAKAKYVIVAIGTPIDKYLNPKTKEFLELFRDVKEYLSLDQTIIIRSTVYPNTCKQILNILGNNKEWKIAYCPERIVQSQAIKELKTLPQIVSGLSEAALHEASKLFITISPKIIKTTVKEAELAKLFANAWRYIQFAVTNEFYMIAHNLGVDYQNLRQIMADGYERATIPTAGFAAGPCLLKDTMQLAAFDKSRFLLGHAAMMINEGLPNFIVENLKTRHKLEQRKVGILGMAFKAETDDIRGSLSYKLGKILRFNCCEVFYSDEYAKDPTFVSKEKLIEKSDIIIVGVPHAPYHGLKIPNNKEVVDLWNTTKGGKRNVF